MESKKERIKGRGSSTLESTVDFISILIIVVCAGLILFNLEEPVNETFIIIGVSGIISSIILRVFTKTIVSINDNLEELKQYKKMEHDKSREIEKDQPFDLQKD
jgi:hypothetical protein